MTADFDLLHNPTFWAGFWAWFLAQFAKMIGSFATTRKFDPYFFLRLGGMPSSHSALASAVTLSVGLREGFGSAVFAFALTYTAIVMIDAAGVRRQAGQQARLLNQIIEEMFQEHRFSQEKLAELLGHTRLEVGLGMLLGVLIALLVHAVVPWA